MNFKTVVLLGLPAFLFGCPGDDPTGTTDPTPVPTAATGDTDVTPTPDPTFTVTLADGDGLDDATNGQDDGDTLTLTITDPPEGSWFFGYAQTQSGEAGWYGESCLSSDYCHAIPAPMAAGDDAVLVLDGTRDINAIVDTGANQTMLLAVDFPVTGTPDNTYYVGAQTNPDDCFVFGDDPSYYGTLNCIDPGANASSNDH